MLNSYLLISTLSFVCCFSITSALGEQAGYTGVHSPVAAVNFEKVDVLLVQSLPVEKQIQVLLNLVCDVRLGLFFIHMSS